MKQIVSRAGFTLIEILVALILIGVLAAFVVPGVVQQVGSADAPKVVNDLTSLRTAVTSFHANMTPAFPGDIEDLVNRPVRGGAANATDSDLALAGTAFTRGQLNRWNGQYIDVLLAEQNAGVAAGDAIRTGFGAQIQQGFICFDPTEAVVATAAGAACATGTQVAAVVTGLDETQFLRINDLIDGDGPAETNASKKALGRLRYDDGTAVAFYLVTPYRG